MFFINEIWKILQIEITNRKKSLYILKAIYYSWTILRKFRKICSEIYQLDPTRFFSTPGLAWQATLKKTKVELQLSTDIDLLFIVEKEIRGGKCCSVNRYAKANNKYVKNYDKNQ